MGIVNAFINQIGREAARDVYRGTRSRAKLPAPEETFIPFNDSFLAEVKNFQIAATSSVTLNHLVNIVEKAENTNIENFEWEDIFIEIDNKIDFCKVELGVNSEEKLNELDEKNANNYKIKNDDHKLYIEGLIKVIDDSNTELNHKNTFLAILFTPFGLNPIYYNQSSARIVLFLFFTFISFICFYYGYKLKVYPLIYMKESNVTGNAAIEGASKIADLLFILGGILYALILSSSLKKINIEIKKKKTNAYQLDLFNKYLKALS